MRSIAGCRLREDANLTILTLVEKDEQGVEHRRVPDPDLVLSDKQSLVVLGQTDAIEAFRARVSADK